MSMNCRRVDGTTASERMKQLLRMFRSVYLSIHLGDLSIFFNDIRDAFCVLILGRFASTVKHSDVTICVAKKWKGEVEFFREFLVFFYGIETDAHDFDVLSSVLIDEVAE